MNTEQIEQDYALEERARGMAMEMYAFVKRMQRTQYLPIDEWLVASEIVVKVEGRE